MADNVKSLWDKVMHANSEYGEEFEIYIPKFNCTKKVIIPKGADIGIMSIEGKENTYALIIYPCEWKWPESIPPLLINSQGKVLCKCPECEKEFTKELDDHSG